MRILKKIYAVIRTDNKNNLIEVGLPCSNKKVAAAALKESYDAAIIALHKSGATVKARRIDKDGYSIQTSDGTEFRGVISLIDLRNARY